MMSIFKRSISYGILTCLTIFLVRALKGSLSIRIQRILAKIEDISYSSIILMEEVPTSIENDTTRSSCQGSLQCDLEALFAKRRLILELACENIDTIVKLKHSKSALEELINFHKKIYSLDYNYFNKLKHSPCKSPKRRKTNIFRVKRFTDLLACLPPKSGTTNFQRALAILEAGGVDKVKPEDLEIPKLFHMITRIKLNESYLSDPSLEHVKFKLANVRNPFARLYSGWNDKFKLESQYDKFYKLYSPGIRPFEGQFPKDNLHRVSFNSFVAFVAANNNENVHDWHWTSQYLHCSPCLLKYKYITHLKHAANETAYLLHTFGVDNITHVPGKEMDNRYDKPINDHTTGPEDYWRTTPRDLIIDVYRHYFQDFLTFGFSPESVMKYINAGLDGNETIRNKYESNKKLSRTHINHHMENLPPFAVPELGEYNICN